MNTAEPHASMLVSIVRALPRNRRVGRAETIPRWSPMSRLALGFCTFLMPLIATAIGVGSLAAGSDPPPVLLAACVGFLVTHAILVMLYIAFAGQNPRLYSRFAWQMAFVFLGPIAEPLYWVMHVWGAPKVGRMDVDEEPPGYDMAEARALGQLSAGVPG